MAAVSKDCLIEKDGNPPECEEAYALLVMALTTIAHIFRANGHLVPTHRLNELKEVLEKLDVVMGAVGDDCLEQSETFMSDAAMLRGVLREARGL